MWAAVESLARGGVFLGEINGGLVFRVNELEARVHDREEVKALNLPGRTFQCVFFSAGSLVSRPLRPSMATSIREGFGFFLGTEVTELPQGAQTIHHGSERRHTTPGACFHSPVYCDHPGFFGGAGKGFKSMAL